MSKRGLKNKEDDEQEESESGLFEPDKLTNAQIKNAEKLPS